MRGFAGTSLNLLAWVVLAGLILVAVLVANRLGFVGLSLLGALTWLVCLRAAMAETMPSWGPAVFRAEMQRPRRPEDRAAQDAERAQTLLPFRFYARCGMALLAIGLAGIAWQAWGG